MDDKTKNESLHFDYVYDVTFERASAVGSPIRFAFYTEYRIHGCALESFTFTTESFRSEGELSETDWTTIQDQLREIRMRELDPNPGAKDDGPENGLIEFDHEMHSVTVPFDHPVRVKLRELVLKLIDRFAPSHRRARVTRTIEGDFVRPRSVALEKLVATPDAFDGKRIRISGFSVWKFERHTLEKYEEKAYHPEREIWLGGASTFANDYAVRVFNRKRVAVEGTFDCHAHGHLGDYPGALVRLTRMKKVDR